MRGYEKKKALRRALQQAAKDGKINDEKGNMVPRQSIKDSSMRRDYMPNRGGK